MVASHLCTVTGYFSSTSYTPMPEGPFDGGKRFLTRESLGYDSIDGLDVVGTRETITLDAGVVGNRNDCGDWPRRNGATIPPTGGAMKRFLPTALLVVVLLGVIAVRIHHHNHSQGLSVGIVTTECDLKTETITNRKIRLLIHNDGSLFINRAPVSRRELGCSLYPIYETRNERILFLDASDAASYQQAVEVIDIAQSAVPDLRVLMITPSTRGKCLFDLEHFSPWPGEEEPRHCN
jgi:biopolymer transport protein ExbD